MKPADHFAAMINALRSTGMTYSEIGRAAQLSQTTVWRHANGEGTQPLFSTYRSVEKLYEKRCLASRERP